MAGYSTCRFCGAKIRWITTTKGKYMPVNPDGIDPDTMKPGEVFVNDFGEVARAENIVSKHTSTWYISHFATCPDAKKKYRKR